MSKKPNNLLGGQAVWGGMFPGMGAVNFLLGWLTVPIEVFLRRRFGERYLTSSNVIAGLLILLLIRFIGWLLLLLNPLSYVSMLFGRSGASAESWMGSITKYYIYLALLHFLGIWWRNITGVPTHTYSAGKSWLRPIGKAVMFVLNLFLNFIVRAIFKLNPALDKGRLAFALPVLQDVDTFTERYIEPIFVLIVAFNAAAVGQTAVFFWLLFSAMALFIYTGQRHEQERGYWLDIQDSMIEASYHRSDSNAGKKSHERMVKKTVFEAEKNPNMMPIIERDNPSLADAMKAVSPKLQKMVNHFPNDTEDRQAA